MWRLEVSAAVRHIYIYMSLGFKRLSCLFVCRVCVLVNGGIFARILD